MDGTAVIFDGSAAASSGGMAEAAAIWKAELALNGVAHCRSDSDSSIRGRLTGRLSPSGAAAAERGCMMPDSRGCKCTTAAYRSERADASADASMRARSNETTEGATSPWASCSGGSDLRRERKAICRGGGRLIGRHRRRPMHREPAQNAAAQSLWHWPAPPPRRAPRLLPPLQPRPTPA